MYHHSSPLQPAFVSLFLAFLALEICFLEMVKHLWLTHCQTYSFPLFLYVRRVQTCWEKYL